MEQILAAVRAFDGVLELAPSEGSEFPEIAWGDHFFYYAPDRQVPQRTQPYATIVTKNYPDDSLSDLDRPDRWRLNIHVGRRASAELIGEEAGEPVDFAAADTLLPHPVYRAQGWVSIVCPGAETFSLAVRLMREAHEAARSRAARR
nr:DUF6194 family protein [Actinomadura chibensis]